MNSDATTAHLLARHARDVEAKIGSLTRSGWAIAHDNGDTVVLTKDPAHVPGDFVGGDLTVTLHRQMPGGHY